MSKTAAFALLGVCLPAFGWGPEGHDLVARIALAQLSPAARAQVAEILGPGETIVSVSSWADEVRSSREETAPWHYIDVPIDQPNLNMTRDCPQGACVVAAIERFRNEVKNPATPPAERREALMFIIHFVGDLHQPLHSSNNQDRGGNDVRVRFQGRSSNLHSLWDSGLMGQMGTEDELYARLLPEAQKNRKKWARGSVEAWVEESHKAAQKTVYGLLPKGSPAVIDAEYERQADPLIEMQLAKAGVRLAAMLNGILP